MLTFFYLVRTQFRFRISVLIRFVNIVPSNFEKTQQHGLINRRDLEN